MRVLAVPTWWPAWGEAAACATVFVLAWLASGSEAGQHVDEELLGELARLPGSSTAWADASWPGDGMVALPIVMLCCAACLALRAWRSAMAAAACIWVFPLVRLVKLAVGRERPATELASEFAMPSGHAASATVAFGVVALILVPAVLRRGWPRWLGPFSRGLWLALAFATGVARVAAGVHWPTDVVAGWAFGGLVLAVGLSVRGPADRPITVLPDETPDPEAPS